MGTFSTRASSIPDGSLAAVVMLMSFPTIRNGMSNERAQSPYIPFHPVPLRCPPTQRPNTSNVGSMVCLSIKDEHVGRRHQHSCNYHGADLPEGYGGFI